MPLFTMRAFYSYSPFFFVLRVLQTCSIASLHLNRYISLLTSAIRAQRGTPSLKVTTTHYEYGKSFVRNMNVLRLLITLLT